VYFNDAYPTCRLGLARLIVNYGQHFSGSLFLLPVTFPMLSAEQRHVSPYWGIKAIFRRLTILSLIAVGLRPDALLGGQVSVFPSESAPLTGDTVPSVDIGLDTPPT